MKFTQVKEQLHIRQVQYLQLTALPEDIRFVLQNGFTERYGAYKGKRFLFLIDGKNMPEVKAAALQTLNKNLRFCALCFKKPSKKQYLEYTGLN